MQFDDRQGGLGAAFRDMQTETGGFADEITAAAEAMRAMDDQAQRLARSLGSSLRSAIDKAIFGGAKLGDVFRDLASDVLSRSLDLAIGPVQSAISSGLTGLVGSLAGGLSGIAGFQKGGVFSSGDVRAFAKGGIVDRPTLFPMRSGVGLMGEAGPEAVMPLTRGADGRLGVMAEGGRGPVVNVTIQTRDAESFARSRGQVAAQLARAVQRGSDRL